MPEQKKPFGVVRASSDGVADIGCTAEIMSVIKKYDDGRLDILTRGVERFEVVEVNEDRSFLQAEIAVVEDEDEDDKPGKPPSEMVAQAVRLHAEITRLAGAEASGPDEHAANLSSCSRVRFRWIWTSSKACSQRCPKRKGWRRSSATLRRSCRV